MGRRPPSLLLSSITPFVSLPPSLKLVVTETSSFLKMSANAHHQGASAGQTPRSAADLAASYQRQLEIQLAYERPRHAKIQQVSYSPRYLKLPSIDPNLP